MGFVKKCKRLLRSSKSVYPEETCSGSYVKLSSDKCHKKQKDSHNKKPPNGFVCVNVGAERQRFIIKIKIFNHPLFETLLEDVENEYGYGKDGPLWLPCNVDMFCEALVGIESAMSSFGIIML
ncbi:auxin-responsive protein SAUR71-like [Lathyrus oleraceus]|uniref:auxin-responsive protein SAUR71-like n=1 Tax=Pisum sativum TaxID=3888 RepID=UPI0021D1FD56|nr:auxin-responsive protein SAUR71-like [Pisum sativum]